MLWISSPPTCHKPYPLPIRCHLFHLNWLFPLAFKHAPLSHHKRKRKKSPLTPCSPSFSSYCSISRSRQQANVFLKNCHLPCIHSLCLIPWPSLVCLPPSSLLKQKPLIRHFQASSCSVSWQHLNLTLLLPTLEMLSSLGFCAPIHPTSFCSCCHCAGSLSFSGPLNIAVPQSLVCSHHVLSPCPPYSDIRHKSRPTIFVLWTPNFISPA